MSASPSISSISYRKVYGEHLKTRATNLFVYNLCNFSSKIERYDVDIPNAVLIFLPIVFSKAGKSGASRLLEAGSFSFDPELPRRFPQENWNQLFSSSYEACKLAIAVKDDEPMIPDSEPMIPDLLVQRSSFPFFTFFYFFLSFLFPFSFFFLFSSPFFFLFFFLFFFFFSIVTRGKTDRLE